MDKKVFNQKKYDDKEDLEIKKIAHSKYFFPRVLIVVLILLFLAMIIISTLFINNYFKKPNTLNNDGEIIEITNSKNNIVINNNGKIQEKIDNNRFKNGNLVIEKINTIELFTDDSSEDGVNFDVKLLLLENDFNKNEISKNDSNLLVRFSYSYDNKNWTYIKNVIRTSNSTLNPLMGNYYDIAGLETTLNINTNFKLKTIKGNNNKMYWKAEFVIKNKDKGKIDNNLIGNFKLVYKDND